MSNEGSHPVRGRDEIARFLSDRLAELLGEDPSAIDADRPFAAWGINSTEGVILAGEVEDWLGLTLSPSVAWDHPSISALSTHLAELLVREAAGASDAASDHSLTPAQERIWIQDRLGAEVGRFQIARAGRCVGGPLDLGALQRALDRLAERHPALRTTFPTCGNRPVQRVHARGQGVLAAHDSRAWSDQEVVQWLHDEAERPFDLETGPLLRCAVLSRRDGALLMVAAHHIVTDAWSMSVLLRDIAALYAAEVAGTTAVLPPLTTTPVEYARKLGERLDGAAGARLWSFWEGQVAGELPTLDIVTDRPRRAVQPYRPGARSLTVPPALVANLRALGEAHGASLPVVVLACFQVLLSRYSGQQDVLVGCETTGRTRANLIDVVGYLANPLVIRADLTGNPPFAAFLGRTARTLRDALAHQDLPFSLLARRFVPKPDRSRTPLFQALFTWPLVPTRHAQALLAFAFDDPQARLQLGDVALEPVPLPRNGPAVDLHLTMAEAADALVGEIVYNAELFDDTTIERMATHLQTLLEAIAENAGTGVADLRLLPSGERSRVVFEWNATSTDYGSDRCVHELVEEQVARSPDAVAVVTEEGTLTYRQLDERANRLAHELGALGVGPDSCVALVVERSLAIVVGMLGILKAGGAYLPVEPSDPPERQGFLCRDAGAQVVVTQSAFADRLDGLAPHLVCLDRLSDGGPASRPPSAVTPRNLMYVMYTSGSTGAPKGVMIEHRGVTNRLRWMVASGLMAADERVLHKTPFTFDISVWEIFAPLLCGARVILARPGGHRDPRYVADLIAEHEVTTVHFVPSVLDLFLEQRDLDRCRDLRRVVSSGEALTFEAQERFFARLPTELYNLYGPTEASIEVAAWRCRPGEGCPVSGGVPIGRPIANTRLYVLDDRMAPVPIGVPGELYIGGCCVARGYANRPELTAERFVADPFVPEAGDPLYRTGDRVRWRDDGAIEFLGRTDRQIKLRGFRIELGEIEAVLRHHPAVRDAVVVVDEHHGGDRLAGYVVPNDPGDALEVLELRGFLQGRLPPYMVPPVLGVVEAMPLTPNGKLDRRALARLGVTMQQAPVARPVAPRGPLEEAIAASWCTALGLDAIGDDDDFFACGGDSLQSISVAIELSDACGRLLPIDVVFRYPTVRELAAFLGDQHAGRTEPARAAAGGAGASLQGAPEASASPWLTVDGRPLIGLLAAGALPEVQAAAVTYLPSMLLDTVPGARAAVDEWCGGLPVLAGLVTPTLGRIALVVLPLFDSELYTNRSRLIGLVDQALQVASRVGAGTVSLTGLLPSALDGGHELAAACASRPCPAITTGHATTVAAVALSVERILSESGRSLAGERLGVLGLGSIGSSSLRLILQTQPHPEEILLCDVPARRAMLEELSHELRGELAFHGVLRVLDSGASVPDALYDATLIVGASSAPGILDVDRMAPGTIVVDDSAPHCFVAARAFDRLAARGDVLFTEGGSLAGPEPVPTVLHVPPALVRLLGRTALRHVGPPLPGGITGCVLSALLSARDDELPPTIGPLSARAGLAHRAALSRLGYGAGAPHLAGVALDPELVERFRGRFAGGR